jgi:hypothetical protein
MYPMKKLVYRFLLTWKSITIAYVGIPRSDTPIRLFINNWEGERQSKIFDVEHFPRYNKNVNVTLR